VVLPVEPTAVLGIALLSTGLQLARQLLLLKVETSGRGNF
jgi:hypothetical protein